MDNQFFSTAAGVADPDYSALAEPQDEQAVAVRDFVEALYRANYDVVGKDLPANARSQFHQCFWELYLAQALRSANLQLESRSERGAKSGPDLRVVEPRVWIEAVAPREGEGLDRVLAPVDGQVRSVPDNEIKLRLLSALAEKRAKLDRYHDKGPVGRDDVFVIAINAGCVSSSGDFAPPRIVRTLYGIGWPAAVFDVEAQKVIATTFAHAPCATKRSGQTISTTCFLDGTAAGVSAVLFSKQTAWNAAPDACWPGKLPGTDFILVHNATAKNPLPTGRIPCAEEYQLQGDQVVRL